MDALARDLRHAARALRASPGLVLLATLSLALGIGANVTVFAWARAVLLEPFSGVPGQDRLVKALQTDRNEELISFSYPDYRDLRDRATTLAGLAAVRNMPVTLGADGRSERVWAQLVSGNFFEVLGVGAQVGRTLPRPTTAPRTRTRSWCSATRCGSAASAAIPGSWGAPCCSTRARTRSSA